MSLVHRGGIAHLPATPSAAISLAITNAHEDHTLLGKALTHRFEHPPLDNVLKTSHMFDQRVKDMIDELSTKTSLAADEVVRLCIEALIYKL